MDANLQEKLVAAARQAALGAYSPYSRIRFGCAVLFENDDKDIYSGANVENAAYGSTICAERVAICAGVVSRQREGKSRQIAYLAISRVDERGASVAGAMPCGACLQVIAEFGSLTTEIVLDNLYRIGDTEVRILGDLLPTPFYIPGDAR